MSDLAGMPEAPVWIRGVSPTDRPVLNGGGEGIHLTRVRWLAVENLEVAGAANNGINCDDGGDYADPEATRWVVFRSLYIHDVGGTGNRDGLKLSGVNDYWVLDSEFARCGGAGSGSGIDQVGCHRGVIAGCYFHELSANAVQCKGGSSEIDILQNRIVDAGQRGINIGGSTGFTFFRPPLSAALTNGEARAIRVAANLFRGGITPVAFVGCIDGVAANNTIIDPEDWHLRILQETVPSPPYGFHPSGRSGFVNNLVYFERARLKNPDVNIGPNTDPATFLFARNLWYARDNAADSAPDLPLPEHGGITGRDPGLADPGAGEYGIMLESAAARGGVPLAGIRRDFGGEPYLGPPSIGAYEIAGDLDGDGLPDAWERRHLGGTNVTAGGALQDADRDNFRDRWEYVAGTDPTNPTSFFAIAAITPQETQRVVPRWTGVARRRYGVYGATNLDDSPPFTRLTNDLPATPDANVYTAHVGAAGAAMLYRLSVTTSLQNGGRVSPRH